MAVSDDVSAPRSKSYVSLNVAPRRRNASPYAAHPQYVPPERPGVKERGGVLCKNTVMLFVCTCGGTVPLRSSAPLPVVLPAYGSRSTEQARCLDLDVPRGLCPSWPVMPAIIVSYSSFSAPRSPSCFKRFARFIVASSVEICCGPSWLVQPAITVP